MDNTNKLKEYHRQYYEKNKQKIINCSKEWYLKQMSDVDEKKRLHMRINLNMATKPIIIKRSVGRPRKIINIVSCSL
jgi:outer membrane lipoprotein-sorting protein